LSLFCVFVVLSVCSVAEARGWRRQNDAYGNGGSGGSVPAVVDKSPVYKVEIQLLKAVNVERRRYGLSELILDPLLHKRTRMHCGWMANNGSMVHSSDPCAENIAMGQHTAQDVVECWMNSPGHRANILNPRHKKIGLAGYLSDGKVAFWCQQFE
jgi:uncharacterized protein YkwD